MRHSAGSTFDFQTHLFWSAQHFEISIHVFQMLGRVTCDSWSVLMLFRMTAVVAQLKLKYIWIRVAYKTVWALENDRDTAQAYFHELMFWQQCASFRVESKIWHHSLFFLSPLRTLCVWNHICKIHNPLKKTTIKIFRERIIIWCPLNHL